MRIWFWIHSKVARSSEPPSVNSIRACTARADSSWRHSPCDSGQASLRLCSLVFQSCIGLWTRSIRGRARARPPTARRGRGRAASQQVQASGEIGIREVARERVEDAGPGRGRAEAEIVAVQQGR